ncbi:MAG: hypothetical protein R3324_16730, partial [Halobacteriales archaeon]|nr:hypothetical protein [Halobacteriales archaeon]
MGRHPLVTTRSVAQADHYDRRFALHAPSEDAPPGTRFETMVAATAFSRSRSHGRAMSDRAEVGAGVASVDLTGRTALVT